MCKTMNENNTSLSSHGLNVLSYDEDDEDDKHYDEHDEYDDERRAVKS